MNYRGSKYFTTSNSRKIKYLLLNEKSQITVVFFHGFMSDMTGTKPSEIQRFCKRKKLIEKSELISEIMAQNPDVLITLGAGDIGLEVPKIKKELSLVHKKQ